ncbi:hypothetical protein ACFQ51_05500 [Streptomyces kaempferi]
MASDGTAATARPRAPDRGWPSCPVRPGKGSDRPKRTASTTVTLDVRGRFVFVRLLRTA